MSTDLNTNEKCPACGQPLVAGAKFCRACGAPASQPARPNETACPSCGTMQIGPAKFCENCGFRLEAAHPAAPSSQGVVPQRALKPSATFSRPRRPGARYLYVLGAVVLVVVCVAVVLILLPPRSLILDKFNGSSVGEAYGITWVRTSTWRGAEFSRINASRIEYPKRIPSEGTLEWWIKVSSGYYDQNFQVHANQPEAMIFSTDAHGGDVTWPGAAKLLVYDNGEVSLYIAISKYNQPPAQPVTAMVTPFRFNQWHAIGISYGSEGEYIMVDGRLVASAPANAQTLGAAGNHQEPLDVPTIGDTVSHFWQPQQYDGGFEGIVRRFRASAVQRDWYLAKGIGD